MVTMATKIEKKTTDRQTKCTKIIKGFSTFYIGI